PKLILDYSHKIFDFPTNEEILKIQQLEKNENESILQNEENFDKEVKEEKKRNLKKDNKEIKEGFLGGMIKMAKNAGTKITETAKNYIRHTKETQVKNFISN